MPIARRAIFSASLATTLPAPLATRAQEVDGPVTIIVPYTPGTGPDILARLVAPALQARLSQPVVVENRAGASGNIGSQVAARAAPDGRTLLMQVNTFVMNPSLFRQVPYDPVTGFTPVAKLTRGDLALVVNPSVEAADVRALVALARARPGALDYASPGNGTPQHLGMALFAQAAGIELNHVPYRGSAPAIQDLLGRRVAAMFLPIHTALPLVADGRIRMLALGSEARAASTPELPTLAEAGFPGVVVDLWYGLLGPAGLPEPLVERLNAMLNAWVTDAAMTEALRAQGMVPTPDTPAAFAALIARDAVRWAQVVREARISVE
jgi:tripartite-type tricarboxylate transporter receptor subunit TctC